MKQANEKYCSECGSVINAKAELCPKCGVRQSMPVLLENAAVTEQRNRWIACLLLCWFFGVLGVHRFYTGHMVLGVAQLLTLGGCGIWALVDLVIILTGGFKDARGNPIKYA